jgi:hypothetical protein
MLKNGESSMASIKECNLTSTIHVEIHGVLDSKQVISLIHTGNLNCFRHVLKQVQKS